MDIAPLAPLIGIDRENRLPALLGAERTQEIFRRMSNRCRRYAGLLNAEQAGNDVAVAGDALKWLGRGSERFLDVVGRAAFGKQRPVRTTLRGGFRQLAGARVGAHDSNSPSFNSVRSDFLL